MTDHLPLSSFFDPRVGVPALVVRGRTITSSNEAARNLFGSLCSESLFDLFDAGSSKRLAAALREAPASCEVQARMTANEIVTVRVSALPLRDGARLILVVRTGAEYSERMAQQLLVANDHLANLARELARQGAELEAARARFEALANLREHFVSMLAHDVRGSLQSIALSVDVLESDGETLSAGALQDGLRRIRRGAMRIRDLVERVLDSARTEMGRMALETRPTSLRAVARETVEVYAPVARLAGVELQLADGSLDPLVSGDEVRLGQVVGNLIENAIRHSPRGAAVTVAITERPERARLVVRDQGPGIPREQREHVFDRSFQTGEKRGALGLGLFVARQIVELHGGSISVEDAPQRGTEMVIELPRVG